MRLITRFYGSPVGFTMADMFPDAMDGRSLKSLEEPSAVISTDA